MIGHTKLLLLVGGAAIAILLLRTFLIPIAKTLPNTPVPLIPTLTNDPTVPNDPTFPTTNPYKSHSPNDPTQAVYQPTTPEDNASGPKPKNSCTTNADCGGGCWRCDTKYGRCITVCNNEP